MRLPSLRGPWRRAPTGPRPSRPIPFDALVDVDPSLAIGPAMGPAIADAIRALPGAAWISVEAHPNPNGVSARLFPPGSSQEADWPDLRTQVEAAARAALPATPAPRPEPLPARWPSHPWPGPASAGPPGFAEARALTEFDALEQLAALAAATTSKPAPADDAGLAARLLGLVVPADPAPAAAAALRRFGSYAAILAAPESELRQVPGLGTHSIAAIKLMHAAAIRLARARVAQAPVLDDRERLAAYLAAALARARIEQFRVLFLDAAGMLKADEVQATGTVNHTPVYPREVVRRALELDAAAIVLVHNHPSGDPEPSPDDIDMTHQVQRAAATMRIELRDHVIVGNGRWLSFREAGLLD